MDYRIQDYEDSYKAEVLAAIDQGYKDIGYSGIELDSLDTDLNDIAKSFAKPSIFKLVFDKDELIATYAVQVKADCAELKRVYVRSDYRGKGIAKKISQDAFAYVASLGLKELDIWSGTLCNAAHNMYQKLGAQKTSRTRDLGGQDQVIEYHFVKALN